MNVHGSLLFYDDPGALRCFHIVITRPSRTLFDHSDSGWAHPWFDNNWNCGDSAGWEYLMPSPVNSRRQPDFLDRCVGEADGCDPTSGEQSNPVSNEDKDGTHD